MKHQFVASRWNRRVILAEIRAMRREKQDLSYVAVCRDNQALVSATGYYFGGWGRAVSDAGIDYDRHRRCQIWSRERIFRAIRQYRTQKADLSYNAMAARDSRLLAATSTHFGSWRAALTRLGMDYEKIRKQRRWTKDRICREIRRQNALATDLSWKAMHRAGHHPVVNAGCHHFGTWGRAIRAAGLDYSRIKKKPGPRKRTI